MELISYSSFADLGLLLPVKTGSVSFSSACNRSLIHVLDVRRRRRRRRRAGQKNCIKKSRGAMEE